MSRLFRLFCQDSFEFWQEQFLTAVSFRIFCALLFAAFVQLAWTVCDDSFDNHFASTQLLILHSAVADFVDGIRCISFRF